MKKRRRARSYSLAIATMPIPSEAALRAVAREAGIPWADVRAVATTVAVVLSVTVSSAVLVAEALSVKEQPYAVVRNVMGPLMVYAGPIAMYMYAVLADDTVSPSAPSASVKMYSWPLTGATKPEQLPVDA